MSIMNRAKKGKAKANTRSILRRFMLFRTSDIRKADPPIYRKHIIIMVSAMKNIPIAFFLFEGSLKPFSL